MRAITETYDRIGDVPAWAHDLERRWQEEEARARVFVSEEQSVLTVSLPTSAPPQVAWAFLTEPGRRTGWQAAVTEIVVTGTTGGRRGPGATNHCMHGKDAIIEEILDWRPYDYLSIRTIVNTPGGTVKMLETIELEPVTSGTTIHYRFAPPATKRELAIMKEIGPPYADMLRASLQTLIAQIEAQHAAGEALAAEAELPAANPDGPLSGIQPLVIVG
jgi:uncharacterized protein YndB with AHSA1/START domain